MTSIRAREPSGKSAKQRRPDFARLGLVLMLGRGEAKEIARLQILRVKRQRALQLIDGLRRHHAVIGVGQRLGVSSPDGPASRPKFSAPARAP